MQPDVTSPLCRPRHNGKKGSHNDRLSTFTAHTLVVQISRGLYSEISTQGIVCRATQGLGRGLSGTSPAESLSGGGRTSVPRSCPHAVEHSAQVCGGRHRGVSEGEERDSHRSDVSRQGAQFHGGEFLGTGLFRRWREIQLESKRRRG